MKLSRERLKNLTWAGFIAVLVIAFIFFMMFFNSTANEQTLRQQFEASCTSWNAQNCGKIGSGEGVPPKICDAYKKMTDAGTCIHDVVAKACNCVEPYGIGRP